MCTWWEYDITRRFWWQKHSGNSPNSFESIMGLVGSTGRKRPHGLALEQKEDSDREDKDLEDDIVEEISPRRLIIRDTWLAPMILRCFYCLLVGKRYKPHQLIFMKRSLSKEHTRMSWLKLWVRRIPDISNSIVWYWWSMMYGFNGIAGTEWKLHKTYLSQVHDV